MKQAKHAIGSATGTSTSDSKSVERISKLLETLEAGPPWAVLSLKEYLRFTREEFLGTLQRLVAELEEESLG